MTSPHIIKLRGGWKRLTESSPEPLTLPCPAQSLAALGQRLILVRRFQHPPLQNNHQIVRLFAANIPATTHIDLDGSPIPLQSLIDGHPIQNHGHRLTLTIETAQLTSQDDWGHVWLSIEP